MTLKEARKIAIKCSGDDQITAEGEAAVILYYEMRRLEKALAAKEERT